MYELDKSLIRLNSYIFFEKQKILKKELKEKNSKEKNYKKYEKNEIEDQNFVQTILRNIRYKNSSINHDNIPLQNETVTIRNKFFKSMSLAKKFELKNNLNKEQLDCIKKFYKDKPFSLCNSDKNVGWVCLDETLYLDLAKDHLFNNNNIYKKLDRNPLEHTTNKILLSLYDLKDKGHISERLLNFLKPKNSCRLGKFKILAKLHKNKFGIRPIINNIGHPTEGLSQFIDLFLQPFVRNSESYIKDSQNLLQNCNGLQVEDSYYLYSCDFESLYTNINSEEAILLITDYFHKNKELDKLSDLNINGFNKILKLILYNNIFSFINYYFIQINGLAMGGKCGPSIANMYVYIKEKNWVLNNFKDKLIIIYKRFIDDIFIISKYDILCSNFLHIFGNLKLNVTCKKEVQFLDLLISKHKYLNILSFKLFTKPTNTFQYLFHTSNHPKHIFKNIPKSLFIRNHRCNSEYLNYLSHSRLLISNLVKRGYEYIDLIKVCLTIGKVDRFSLIDYKQKSRNIEKYNFNNLKFIINYDINYISLKNDFNNIIFETKNDFNWLKDYKFSLLNSMFSNFNNIFINNNNVLSMKSYKTLKCHNTNCITCKFIYEKNFLRINDFHLPMLSNCNCESTNLVYIIFCVKCKVYYIGQTSRKFSARFKEHVNNICKFKDLIISNSELSIHFNKNKHILYSDLRFLLFKDKINELNIRLSIETDLIHIFKNLNFNILNKMIPSTHFIKKLSFT